MSDLISRQDAIDAIRASASKFTGFMEMEMYTDDDDAVEAINGVPSAEPVRHWKWTEVVRECFDIQGFKTWGIKCMCNRCGFKTIVIEGHFAQYNYCPNCGARMDKDD